MPREANCSTGRGDRCRNVTKPQAECRIAISCHERPRRGACDGDDAGGKAGRVLGGGAGDVLQPDLRRRPDRRMARLARLRRRPGERQHSARTRNTPDTVAAARARLPGPDGCGPRCGARRTPRLEPHGGGVRDDVRRPDQHQLLRPAGVGGAPARRGARRGSSRSCSRRSTPSCTPSTSSATDS